MYTINTKRNNLIFLKSAYLISGTYALGFIAAAFKNRISWNLALFCVMLYSCTMMTVTYMYKKDNTNPTIKYIVSVVFTIPYALISFTTDSHIMYLFTLNKRRS